MPHSGITPRMLRCSSRPRPLGRTRGASPTSPGCPFQSGSCQVLGKRLGSVPLATAGAGNGKVCGRNTKLHIRPLQHGASPIPKGFSTVFLFFIFTARGVFLALTRPRDQISNRIGEFAVGNPWDLPCKLNPAPAAKDELGFPPAAAPAELGVTSSIPHPQE